MDSKSGHKNVLLVEDDLTLGDLTSFILEKHGYTVTWFVRARFINGSLTFMNDRGVETSFVDSLLAAGVYQFALVDSRLKGSVLQGVDVTTVLAKAGIKVIACSGLPWLNDEMVKVGALCGLEKQDIYTVLKIGDDFLQSIRAYKDKKAKK
jgi:DNA-binding response OmpR family regulator